MGTASSRPRTASGREQGIFFRVFSGLAETYRSAESSRRGAVPQFLGVSASLWESIAIARPFGVAVVSLMRVTGCSQATSPVVDGSALTGASDLGRLAAGSFNCEILQYTDHNRRSRAPLATSEPSGSPGRRSRRGDARSSWNCAAAPPMSFREASARANGSSGLARTRRTIHRRRLQRRCGRCLMPAALPRGCRARPWRSS